MTSTKGKEFSATVQFNADKRYVEFLFDRSNNNQQAQTNQQNNQQGNQQSQPQEAPKTFRGKELDNEQYDKFKAGQFRCQIHLAHTGHKLVRLMLFCYLSSLIGIFRISFFYWCYSVGLRDRPVSNHWQLF